MVLTRSRAQTRSEVGQCNEDSNPKLRHGHNVHVHSVRFSVILSVSEESVYRSFTPLRFVQDDRVAIPFGMTAGVP